MAGSSAPRRATDPAATPSPPPPASSRAGRGVWNSLADHALEVIVALLLTLVCFGSFLVLMGAAFPAGESLRDIVLQGRRPPELASFEDRRGSTAADDAAHTVIASLDVLRPDVRRRASETIAWSPAHNGQPLHDRDAVQTGADGRALVRFGKRNELQLEQNSFVVVMAPRPESRPAVDAGEQGGVNTPDGGEAPPRRGLVLMEGELMARLQAPDKTRLELSLPNVIARLADSTSRTPANFRVTVRKDQSATVAVLDGRLNLESRTGVVSIGPRQFSRVTAAGDVSSPRSLPGAPSECLPEAASSFAHLDLPPRVKFAWSGVPGASQYRLRAARDPKFNDVALDEIVTADSLTWGRAKPGHYWWQVSAVVDEVEGIPTPARTLIVQRDDLPPKLVVEPPLRVVREAQLVLQGEADPRAHVHVMGRPAAPDRDGRFRIALELQPGANVIVVEAVDAAGHTSYWSQVVHLKP